MAHWGSFQSGGYDPDWVLAVAFPAWPVALEIQGSLSGNDLLHTSNMVLLERLVFCHRTPDVVTSSPVLVGLVDSEIEIGF